MAACYCCCRGMPQKGGNYPTLWKLNLSDLSTVWWRGRFTSPPGSTYTFGNGHVLVDGNAAYEVGDDITIGDDGEGVKWNSLSGQPSTSWRLHTGEDCYGVASDFNNTSLLWGSYDKFGDSRLQIINKATGAVSSRSAADVGTFGNPIAVAGGVILGPRLHYLNSTRAQAAFYFTDVDTLDTSRTAMTYGIVEAGDYYFGANASTMYLWDDTLTQVDSRSQTAFFERHTISGNNEKLVALDNVFAKVWMMDATDLSIDDWSVTLTGGINNSPKMWTLDGSNNVYGLKNSVDIVRLSASDGSTDWTQSSITGQNGVVYESVNDRLIVYGKMTYSSNLYGAISLNASTGAVVATATCGTRGQIITGSGLTTGPMRYAQIAGDYIYLCGGPGTPE